MRFSHRPPTSRWAVIVLAVLAAGCEDDGPLGPGASDPQVPPGVNVVLQWNQVALQAIRDAKPGPPQTARSLAIVHTAMYDAWAPYDEFAVGTRLGSELRRPQEEWTVGRKSKAISFAAFRALSDQFPTEVPKFRQKMQALGYDAEDGSRDRATPSGVGNAAAAAVVAYRHVDGSNQLGDLAPGAFADYTGYTPQNPALDPLVPTLAADLPAAIPSPGRWQPLTWVNAAGQRVTPAFVCPQWGRVVPFAMTSPQQFRPQPPAAWGAPAFAAQCDELIELSAALDDEKKCIAEYWADGPSSELPPGHFNLFAQWVSARDAHTLDEDVRMFFALTNAVFDAGIAVWDAKAYYDYCRPVTAIRALYCGHIIRSWGGPGVGPLDMDGGAWRPYQPTTFPTPPFAEYTSGHSAFSAAAAEVLRRFTGSDAFGFSYTVLQGSLKTEPGIAPTGDMTFTLATFSEAADQAGISRRYGGIHFADADLRSREMGRRCGAQAWSKAQALWLGQGRIASLHADGER